MNNCNPFDLLLKDIRNFIKYLPLAFVMSACTDVASAQIYKNNIAIDESILNAKLVHSSKNLDMYAALNEKEKDQEGGLPIFALTFYRNTSFYAAVRYIENQKHSLHNEGMSVIEEEIVDTFVDDCRYYMLTMTVAKKEEKTSTKMVYGFALRNEDVAFFLGDTMGKNMYLKRLQKTFFSLKIM